MSVSSRSRRAVTVAKIGTEVAVDKPLGFAIGGKRGKEGVYVTFVNPIGNAAKAGLKSGDQLLYTSSFFGDEMWPCDSLNFTKTTINQNSRDYMDFIINRGEAITVPKNKMPAPPRFGKALSKSQQALATHICLDCGFVYCKKTPFDELPSDFPCPQCSAPKKRFARYDPETGRALGGQVAPILTTVATALGLVAMAGLVSKL